MNRQEEELTKIVIKHRTDQWNADDFIAGPRTFTIAEVRPGKAEQQYDIELVEGEGKSWRPPVQVLMLLVAAWGDDAIAWRGRRVTLYRDESVKFGPDQVGGIRVSNMSDLPDGKPFRTKVTATRGKRITVSAEPLREAPAPAPTATATAGNDLNAAKQRVWQAHKATQPDLSDTDRKVEVAQLIAEQGLDPNSAADMDKLVGVINGD